jgi:hypothetical protein
MATPTDNANHTSTRRVSWMAWRKRCMFQIMSDTLDIFGTFVRPR